MKMRSMSWKLKQGDKLNAQNGMKRENLDLQQHGQKYEPVALMEYEKFMFNRRTPVKVLPCGLVVSRGCPVLGATPDA
ncbi:unnamed protein product [Pocillopora meandrina]|uniref:Uncharacterized protein n=1 Tax=Pocillopora meandrina TaxID=46732 RepID=A0AAU9WAK0_9CNID|nr:unnamed protein product [Pocillopora meandrina]